MENKKNKVNQREALFFKDGDPNFTGVTIPVNQRKYQSIEKLLEELNEKVHLPNGVRNIMTPNGNHQVKWLHEIDDGKKYVCSSSNKIKKINYTNIQKKPRFRVPRPPSSRVYEPFRKKNPPLFSERRQFKSLTIISKKDSNNAANIILTNRVKNIDTLFEEIGEKLGGKVVALTTVDGKPISLLSELFKNGDCFYAEIGEVSHEKPSSVPISFYKNHKLKLNGSSPKPMTSSSAKLHRQPDISNVTKKNKISPRKKDTSWLLTIKTSDVDDATSDNFAFIVLYGKHGKTNEYSLGVPEHAKGYYRDSISEVEIKTADIGDLYKIRVGHDDNGVALGWHVDTILLTNLDTMKEYLFKCNRWFSREKDDGEIMRELPLYKNGKPILPVIEYEVIVYTGFYDDSNANFDIFVVVEGEKGDTGKRYLEVSLSNAFRSKSIDTFSMEAVYLGQIKDVVITAEAINVDEELAWFAEKVVVRDTVSGIEYNFPLTSDEKAKTEEFVNNVTPTLKSHSLTPSLPLNDEKLTSLSPSSSYNRKPKSITSVQHDEKVTDVISKRSSPQLTSHNFKNASTNSVETLRTLGKSTSPISTSPVPSTITNRLDSDETFDQSERSWYSNSSDATHSENRNEYADDELPDESIMNDGIQVVAFSKVTGRALCFNSLSKKVHAFGQENFCCIWTVLDGNTEESVLLYSLQGDGYLAIDQSGVTLTKGGPGVINEFYVIISESSEAKEISLESVVHSGIFLCSDNYGYVFGSEGQSEATKFLLTHKTYDINEFSLEESGCPHFIMPSLLYSQNDKVKTVKTQLADTEVNKIDIENKEKRKVKTENEYYQVRSPILVDEEIKKEKIHEKTREPDTGNEEQNYRNDKTKNRKAHEKTEKNKEKENEIEIEKEVKEKTREADTGNRHRTRGMDTGNEEKNYRNNKTKNKKIEKNKEKENEIEKEVKEYKERKNEIQKNERSNLREERENILESEDEEKNKKEEDITEKLLTEKTSEIPTANKTKKRYRFKKKKKQLKANVEVEKKIHEMHEYQFDKTNVEYVSNNCSGNESDVIEMRLDTEDTLSSSHHVNLSDEDLKQEKYFDNMLNNEDVFTNENNEEEYFIVLRAESVCKNDFGENEIDAEKINNVNVPNLANESNVDESKSQFFDEENSFDEASIYKNSNIEDGYGSDNFERDNESDDYFEWEDDGKSQQAHHFDTTQVSQSRPHSMTLHYTDRPTIARTYSLPNKYSPLLPIKPNDFLQQNSTAVENRPASSGPPLSSIICETDYLNKDVQSSVYVNTGDCEVDSSMLNFSNRSEKSEREIEGSLITSAKSWNHTDDIVLNNSTKLHQHYAPLENNIVSSMLVEEPSRPDSCITMNVASSPSHNDFTWNLFD